MAPPPTILVTGATGNTGRGVVQELSELLKTNKYLSGHRVIATTRSASSAASQELARLPGIEVVEQNWIDISEEWLKERGVTRAFVASQPQPAQFAEESAFLIALLGAGVEYVVRISTNGPNVRPDFKATYCRAHWALETLLATPEFSSLQWTSLQPNAFAPLYLGTAAGLIREYKKTGKQSTLRIAGSADAPVATIDPIEIGVLAARLLALEDTTPHTGKKYIVNGPEDLTGNQLVKLVEERIGTKVEDVSFNDLSFVDSWAATVPADQKSFILSIKNSFNILTKDNPAARSTTSPEVLQLAPPKHTPVEMLEELLAQQ